MKKLLLILICLPMIGFRQNDIEKTYYENGNLKSEITTNNGIEHSIWSIYYENGKLKIEAEWKDGKPNGIWKYYDEKSLLIKISKYLNGELIVENWL